MVGREFDLSRLRIMLSTGSVLSAELYEWFYSTAFPPSAQLISMSGGTDIAEQMNTYQWSSLVHQENWSVQNPFQANHLPS
ncbi:hypothetical protein LB505_013987 [Fusarium chuoi]|nr:hypothetical protein LB505_013987 [Fusarium chuoi]